MSTARNAAWAVAQFGSGRMIVFVSTIVLARLLEPESFGLLAIGLLAVNVFDRFKDLGVGPALVQSERRWKELAPTAVLLTALSSVAMGAILFLLAPQLAYLLSNEEEVPGLLRGLSVFLVVSGLSVVPDAALRRRLQFRRRTVPEVGGAAVKAVASIVLALCGFEVWSLVWGQVVGSVFTTGAYWHAYLREQHPRQLVGWSTDMARRLTGFGMSMSWLSLVALLLDNVDYFAIARRLGATELGYYTIAFRLPELAVIGVVIVIGQVLFSTFSRAQADPLELRRMFLSASTAVSCVTVPIGLGLAAAAPNIVPALFGGQYLPAIAMLSALGIYATVYSLSFHAGEVYKALGRIQILGWLSLVKAVLLVPAVWWAAGRSALTVAAAFTVCHLILTLIRLYVIRRVLDLSVAEQVASVAPALTAGAAMAVVVLGLGRLTSGAPHLLALILQLLVGGLTYLVVLLVLSPGSLAQLFEVLRPQQLSDALVAQRRAGLTTVVRALGGQPDEQVSVVHAVNLPEAARRLRHLGDRLPQVFILTVDSATLHAMAREAARHDWQNLGVFAVFPKALAPTHLVRSEVRAARAWYSDGPRPVWGRLSKFSASAGRLPWVGQFTFQGQAMVVSRHGQHRWPGTPDGAPPWVVHLGEENSAGRAILTYGDLASSALVRHVRIEPDRTPPDADRGAAAHLPRELAALQLLDRRQVLTGRRPSPESLGITVPGVKLLAQTHLNGETLTARWRRDPASLPADLPVVFALLSELRRVDLSPEELAELRGVAHLDVSQLRDDHLPARVRELAEQGAALAGGRTVLCHGDVWPRNVLWNGGPGLIDWENAHAGAGITDAVMFAVTSLRHLPGVQPTVADAAVALHQAKSEPAQVARLELEKVVATITPDPAPAWRQLMVHAMCMIAVLPAPGGSHDHARRTAWLQAATEFAVRSEDPPA